MDSIDTSKTVKIAYSRFKLSLYLAGCLLVVAGLAWFIVSDVPLPTFYTLLICLVLSSFAGSTLLLLWKFAHSDAALTLSPDGIHDASVTDEAVPWSAVNFVSGYKMRRQKFVFVAIAPTFPMGAYIKRSVRWMNFGQIPAALNIGLVLFAIKQEELLPLIEAYARAHGAPLA